MKQWKAFSILAAALLALTVSSCKVEEPEQPVDPEKPVLVEGMSFTATTVSNDWVEETKTALSDNGNGYDVVWTADDEIVVTDGASHAGRYLLTSEPGLTTGEFTYIAQSGSPATVSGFRAWYPAAVYNGGAPAYPATQTYVADNISGAPMFAAGNDTHLSFRNLGGIIRLNLTSDDGSFKVRRILLSANRPMSGPIDEPEVLHPSGPLATLTGSAGVTLDCGSGVTIGTEPTAFHIAVPAGSYSNLSITVETTAGTRQTRTSNKDILVGRSEYTTISLSFNALDMNAVDLSARGTANTYIVSAAGAYKFRATVKGNGGLDPVTGATATAIPASSIAKAKVLWELREKGQTIRCVNDEYDVFYNDGYVYFHTPDVFTPGGAYIAVCDGEDNILWSWLIWGTDAPDYIEYNGSVFMDRNLGAIVGTGYESGYAYQWGRPAPFAAALGKAYTPFIYYPARTTAFSFEAIGAGKTVDYSVTHPVTFLYSDGRANWMSDAAYKYNIWSDAVKTIYDPSPFGWKVPSKEQLTGITSAISFYGAGFIGPGSNTDFGYGNPGSVLLWSSTSDSTDGYTGAWANAYGSMTKKYGSYPDVDMAAGLNIRPVEDPASIDVEDYTDLSANGTANSYIISTPGRYRINATVKGNGRSNLAGVTKTTAANTIAKAEVLWTSFGNLTTPASNAFVKRIFVKDGYLCFETNPTFSEGNAAVCIKDAGDNILWSWHLWFEEDDLENLAQQYPAGVVFMDRNLGATANAYSNDSDTYDFGLMYQWGRKDPFLNKGMLRSESSMPNPPYRNTGRTPYLLNGEMTVAQAIQSPTQYAMRGESEWYPSSQEGKNYLWSESKTIFDPCPPGWKVPAQMDFDDTFLNAWTSMEYDYESKGYAVPITGGEEVWLPGASYRPGNMISYNYKLNYNFQYNTYINSYELGSGIPHLWLTDGALGWRRVRLTNRVALPDENWDLNGVFNLDQDMNIPWAEINCDYYTTGLNIYRSSLYPVRCIREDSQRVEPESVSLNITSATIYVGDQLQLVATVSPANSVRTGVRWTSSGTASVLGFDQNGLVTCNDYYPYDPEYQVITVTATTYNGKSASCVLTIKRPPLQAVDLGLPSGKKWANMNVGALDPHRYGGYYAWGEISSNKSNYDWSTYRFGTEDDRTKYNSDDGLRVLELADDAAYRYHGSPWRTPTVAEWRELSNSSYTTWTWVSRYSLNNMDFCGYIITSKSNGNSIFLPAAGYKEGTHSYDVGTVGYYMTANCEYGGVHPHTFCDYFAIGGSYDLSVQSNRTREIGYTVRAIQDP